MRFYRVLFRRTYLLDRKPESLARFLPGVIARLYQILVGDFKQGPAVFILALDIFGLVRLTSYLPDEIQLFLTFFVFSTSSLV